jgi:hypothetical protein
MIANPTKTPVCRVGAQCRICPPFVTDETTTKLDLEQSLVWSIHIE